LTFKVGDKVVIKPYRWFVENCEESPMGYLSYKYGDVAFLPNNFVFHHKTGNVPFLNRMIKYCGKVYIVLAIKPRNYTMHTGYEYYFIDKSGMYEDWMLEDEIYAKLDRCLKII
jgi:hypothetical protein